VLKAEDHLGYERLAEEVNLSQSTSILLSLTPKL